MKFLKQNLFVCMALSLGLTAQAQQADIGNWSKDFSDASETLRTVGRGSCCIADGSVSLQSSYSSDSVLRT